MTMMLDGEFRETADGWLVRFERKFGLPPARVWAALTDTAVLKNWLGDVEVEPRIGGRYILRFRDPGVVMTGEVTAWEPERVLEHTWLENYGMPQSLLRWEILPEAGGCRLVLAHRFPANCKRDQVLPFLGGWHAFLDAVDTAAHGNFVPYADEKPIDAAYRRKYAIEGAEQ